MADSSAAYPARLVSYIELVGAATVCRSQNIMAALVLLLQLAAQDLVEDLKRFLEANWTDLVRFAHGRFDIEFYERELEEGRFNDLLVEAACRMRNMQLLVRHLGAPADTSRVFGMHGPLHEIVEVDGGWFTFGQPIVSWSEKALEVMAQLEQSHYAAANEEEAVDIPGPSHVRRSSRRNRRMAGSLKPTTLKKTSTKRHLKFEVISSPIPPYVRSILTSTRAAAKRLSVQARRTLLSRVHFNEVAVVADISPLADKVPNVVRLPEDTVRQDDGDALEMVRADEGEEIEETAAEEHEVAEVVESGRQEETAVVEEPEVPEEASRVEEVNEPEAAVGGNEGEQAVVEQEEEQALAEQEEEQVVAGENEEQAVAGQEDEIQAPAAEVVELEEPAFELENNTYACRLPGCPTPRKRFATLKGWKIHAAKTRIHQQQGYCTSCGHYVLIPPQVEDHEKKIWLDNHRRERCESASRAILKARRLEKERLEALWRDASHVRLPDEDEVQVRRGQKRTYPTEDQRRAGICLAYIKHFKTVNPARLDEVAADFQLTIL